VDTSDGIYKTGGSIMPIYVWVGKTKKGRSIKGELEAADERIARIQLKKRSIHE